MMRILVVLLGLSMGVGVAGAATFSESLESLRKEQNLPGIAVIVQKDGKPVAQSAVGVKRLGKPDTLSLDNRYAIGSITKRMTGLLIARLADAGKFTYASTLAELLPGAAMREEYRKVTLQQLLDFTGGIPGYERIGPRLTPQLFDLEGTLPERRRKFIAFLLQEMPAGPAGGEARYSNASYTLLAHVAEVVTGKTYEDLMAEQVFRPLGLASAGWGRPWQPSRPDEPWLHLAGPSGYEAEPDRERPPEQIFVAAGGVHVSMPDFARFAQYELDALQGRDPLLKPETSRRWHGKAPEGNRPVTRAGGTPALSACYALWPAKGMFMVMAVNGGSPGDAACKGVTKLVEERGPAP